MPKKLMTPVATALGAGLSAATLGLAVPAQALPVAGDNAADAIAELESDDNRVIVENRSDVPLSQTEVVSVIEGPAVRDTVYQNDQYVINENRQRVPVGDVYYVTVR